MIRDLTVNLAKISPEHGANVLNINFLSSRAVFLIFSCKCSTAHHQHSGAPACVCVTTDILSCNYLVTESIQDKGKHPRFSIALYCGEATFVDVFD